jgi:hypothetical protein
MRKRYRDKTRSCALCKPQKRGWAHRWSAREMALFESSEREIAEALEAKERPTCHSSGRLRRSLRSLSRPPLKGRVVSGEESLD